MKKGFTLTELMAAVIIIGVIALIAFPIILNMVKQTEKELDDTSKELVINAAKKYIAKYQNQYPKKIDNVYYIAIPTLINDDLVEDDFISTTPLDNNSCVRVLVDEDYEYEIQTSCEGNTEFTDEKKPEITVTVTNKKTDRATVLATCTDATGITKYEYSSDNGATYVDGGLNASYTFTGLTQGKKYIFKARCTNSSGLTSSARDTVVIPTIIAPTIRQTAQNVEGQTWAISRTIEITYYNNNTETAKYYYSNDGVNWTEHTDSTTNTGSTTKSIVFTNNGYLYAKTVDSSGNTAISSTYTVTNIDSTEPIVSVSTNSIKTDRVTLVATCSDPESGITKYQFSRDGGALWHDNGTNPVYTFDSLTQNTTYNFMALCRNGSLLSNSDTVSAKTSSVPNPTITQASQDPDGTWTQKRVIRISYTSTDVVEPTYYFKSTVPATVKSGLVKATCGRENSPGVCNNSSSDTTLVAGTWYQVNSTDATATADITYTQNGALYAATKDTKGNVGASSTYSIVNIDTTGPSVSGTASDVTGTSVTINATCSDSESGISKYEFSSDNGQNFVDNVLNSSYTFNNLTGSTTYNFKVRCTNGSGIQNTSSTITATTLQDCPAVETTYNFVYRGTIQEFEVPCSGTYKLEVWGAQGGSLTVDTNGGLSEGGKGGYSSGNIVIDKNTTPKLYVAVGGSPGNTHIVTNSSSLYTIDTSVGRGGYNGGGNGSTYYNRVECGYNDDDDYGCHAWDDNGGGGGGATHIAKSTGELKNLSSNISSLLIVAGGGGGCGEPNRGSLFPGGAGGGLNGIQAVYAEWDDEDDEWDYTYGPGGGTQTSGGKGTGWDFIRERDTDGEFGTGASVVSWYAGGGGGGGFYGGGAGGADNYNSGGGGSGYIGGVSNGQTIAGDQTFLSPSGTNETGHSGNGYARITLISY